MSIQLTKVVTEEEKVAKLVTDLNSMNIGDELLLKNGSFVRKFFGDGMLRAPSTTYTGNMKIELIRVKDLPNPPHYVLSSLDKKFKSQFSVRSWRRDISTEDGKKEFYAGASAEIAVLSTDPGIERFELYTKRKSFIKSD